uniref:Uncharacterized protein n=1 Tax=Arundo donax TaxID=35708 RepID=A0A0A9GPS3_ARUDO
MGYLMRFDFLRQQKIDAIHLITVTMKTFAKQGCLFTIFLCATTTGCGLGCTFSGTAGNGTASLQSCCAISLSRTTCAFSSPMDMMACRIDSRSTSSACSLALSFCISSSAHGGITGTPCTASTVYTRSLSSSPSGASRSTKRGNSSANAMQQLYEKPSPESVRAWRDCRGDMEMTPLGSSSRPGNLLSRWWVRGVPTSADAGWSRHRMEG